MGGEFVYVTEHLFLYPDPEAAVVVWDMDNQQEVGRLEGHDEEAFRIIAARGNIAVSNHDSGPRLWNLETLQCTATLLDDKMSTASIAGNKMLLVHESGSYDIDVWDIAPDAPVALANLEGHIQAVSSIKTSTDMALSGSEDKTVRLWDLRAGRCVRTMEGHSGQVWAADMDGQCRTAVSASEDKTLKLWNLGDGRCIDTYGVPSRGCVDVVMHENGSSFLSAGCNDYIVKTWVVGNTEARMTADFKASRRPGGYNSLFASRDLSRVAYCCTSDGKLELRYWK